MLITITDVQAEVDRYLELHQQAGQIKREMDKLKDSIRGHMKAEELNAIESDTHGKQVYLQRARASNSTPRYTDYELKDVMQVLDGKDLKKVTEIRVNADKLKGLISVLPMETAQALEAVKVTKEGTPRFSVKNK